jgi:hypothetical protein
MKRRLFLIAGFLCLLVLAGVIFWWATSLASGASGDRITLPDGSWVRLEAVTSGTNHLVGPRLAMLASKMPPMARRLMVRVFGRRASMFVGTNTKTPQVVLWFSRETKGSSSRLSSPGHLQCVPTDTNGFYADASGFITGLDSPLSLYPVTLNSFPRRDPKLRLMIHHQNVWGTVSPCGQIRIPNPLYRLYPEWMPEPLPVTKQADDLVVTLHRFVANADKGSTAREQHDESWQLEIKPAGTNQTPINLAHVTLRSTTQSNVNWQVTSVEVQDATGNQIGCRDLKWGGLGKDWCSFLPGLWTNEPAWKVTFGVKRTSGFQPVELLKFQNVPLGELNQSSRVDRTVNAQGVTVTLTSLLRRAPALENLFSRSNLSAVEFEINSRNANQNLDLIEATTDDGTRLSFTHQNQWRAANRWGRTYLFGTIPRSARMADFTFAVPTNYSVEFLVKPEAATESTQIRVEPE